MAWNWHECIPLSVLSTVEVFSSHIAHIYVSTEAVWRCPFPILFSWPLHTASVDSNFLCKIRHFMCLVYMWLLGSVPWSLNCGYYTIISLQLWNMTCYCTVHDHLWRHRQISLQVVMHHMWWSSPKIQHQKQSFLGKYYSIMAWNWHECIPLSVLSTVEVFSSTILHILRVHGSSMKVSISIYSAGPTYCFRGQ